MNPENQEENIATSEVESTEEETPTVLYWVGEKAVIAVSKTEEVDLVGVLYADDSNEDFTTGQWESVKSDTPYSNGDVPLRKYASAIKEIIKILMAERCDINSFHFPLQRVEATIGENYRLSIAKLYGVDAVEHIHLSDIHGILTNENTSE